MNLSAHVIDTHGSVVTFMLCDMDSGKEIVRSYTKNDLPQLRRVIDASQKYFLYLEHGSRVAEQYSQQSKELQANLSKVVEQLESENERTRQGFA